MANTDFSVLLKAVLDKTGISTELEQVQKIVNKYSIDIMPELKSASLKNQIKAISQDIANDFNKTFGTNITGKDVFKAYENQAKQAEKAISDAQKKRLSEQEKYYTRIINNNKEIYSLKEKKLSADKEEGKELQRQITNLEKKNKRAYDSISQKGLGDKDWGQQLSVSKRELENRLAIKEARLRDKANALEQVAIEKQIAEYNKQELEYQKQREQYKAKGEQQALDEELLRQSMEYYEQERQYQETRAKYLAEGKAQEEAYNMEVQETTEYYKQMAKEAEKAYELRQRLAKANENEVNKIQRSLDTEEYSKDISKINSEISKIGKFTLSDQSNVDIFNKAQASAQALKTTYDTLKTTMVDANATDQQKIEIEKEYQKLLSTTKNLLSQINISKDDEKVGIGDDRRVNMIATLNSYLKKNTAMTRDSKKQIEIWIETLATSDELTVGSIKHINSEFKQLDATLRKTGHLGLSVADKFKQAFEKFGGWSLVTGTITKLWNSLGRVYNEAIKLDDAVTSLTMATGANEKQINDLLNSYSKLGDELKATISDVAISGTEWLKQGKSIAEAEMLIKNSMILSKVGSLSSADSTKYLTSAMKGYNVEAKNTLEIVDKLSAVDMASATDVGGLAEGMSAVAASAQLAGVSMDRLLGYLATVGEITQDGMASVGTAYNAIFARMGNIKLSRLKDYETGEDLSNVETVLRGVGISLRNSQDEFRNFDEVLDETADRWDSFSGVQQRAIANAFAGTHHVDSFITLMLNYDKALEYTEKSMSSTGQAMEKFAAYEQSVAGHTELFNKSVQDLANTAVDSGLINFFIDLGTTGVKSIDNIIEGAKELKSLGGIAIGITSGLLMNSKGIGKRTMFQW